MTTAAQARLAAALVVLALLAVDPWGWDSFRPLRWMAISTVAALAVGASLKGPLVASRLPTRVFAGLVVWMGVAAALGDDPLHAWLGTPDRHLGWLSWVLFAGVFLVGQTLVKDHAVDLVLRTMVVAGGLVGLYSLTELLGWSVIDVSFAGGRVGGPWGQPAYLGAAALLCLAVAGGVAADSRFEPRWRLVAGGSAVLNLVAVLASQTRGAWIGLVVMAVALLWTMRGQVAVHGRTAVMVGAAVVGLGIVLALASPLGDRAASTFDFGEGTSQGRVDEWRVATRALVDQPVFGAGPEGYRVVLGRHVDATYERRHGRQVIPDRAHNTFLDVGVTGGVVALLLYLALAVLLLRSCVRALRGGTPWLMGVALAVVGFLVQQLFLFPVAEVDPVFWLLAGMVVMHTSSEGDWQILTVPAIARVPVWALAAALALTGAFDVIADHRTSAAVDAAARGDDAAAKAAIGDATSLRPDSIRYHFIASRLASQGQAGDRLQVALAEVDRGLELSPKDPALLGERATLLVEEALGRLGNYVGVPAATTELAQLVANDPNNAERRLQYGLLLAAVDAPGAEQQLLVAAELAPRNPVPELNLARLYLQQGRSANAMAALQRAQAIAPHDPRVVALLEQVS